MINALDENGETALFRAVSRRSLEQVCDLLARGSDPNVNKVFAGGHSAWLFWSPLHVAAIWGEFEIVRRLVAAGANPSACGAWNGDKGPTPLLIAIEKNFGEIVDFLIWSGADCDQTDALETTPIHMATFYNRLESMKTLIAFGGDIDQPSDTMPLATAAFHNRRVEFVSLLLSLNARCSSSFDRTALRPDIRELFVNHEKKTVMDDLI
jgi:ankyrin repeat protein